MKLFLIFLLVAFTPMLFWVAGYVFQALWNCFQNGRRTLNQQLPPPWPQEPKVRDSLYTFNR